MSFSHLRSFVDFLEGKGDLCRVKAEVDSELEVTEIATRVFREKGPALLFENVKGSAFPLLINVLGTPSRIEAALGRAPAEVGEALTKAAESFLPPTPRKIWDERFTLSRFLSMRLKPKRAAPVMAHRISPADLSRLPILKCWPFDAGRFITFPLVVTKSPVDGRQNLGVYRMQAFNARETGMHWQISRGGGAHYQEAERRNEPLPLAAVVGADPILLLAGVLPLPEGLDEMAFAGFLRGRQTETVSCCGGRLAVPAEAEFLLEGVVPPNERRTEGPFGDHFGHYSQEALFPVFHIERIYHRDNPIFPVAVVGKPPQEDQVIGDAIQEMLVPLLKLMHPELVDLWAYQEAGFHNLLVASVNERFEKEALKTALWILGEGQLAMTKCVVLVGPKVNVRRFDEVLRALRDHFDPSEDFILLPGTSQDTLDFTSFKMNLGSKMILDATVRSPKPAPRREVDIDKIKRLDSRILGARLVENSLLALQVKSDGRSVLEGVLASSLLGPVPIVAAVSADIPLNDPVLLIWGLFTRFDCERDTFFSQASLQKGHPVYGGTLAIDATWKEGYPAPLSMSEEVVKKVDQRWKEYQIK